MLLITCSDPTINTANAHKKTSDCIKPPSNDQENLIWIEGGTLTVGSNQNYQEEAKAYITQIDGFWISTHEVTNDQFKTFVNDTRYVTVAERYLSEEDFPDIPEEQRSPGSVVFIPPTSASEHPMNWWQFVVGANWRHPEGPESSIEGKDLFPVVHIAYQDALAYAKWKGQDLPTEEEWEYVAKSKRKQSKYAWGDTLTLENQHQANTWQGAFPLNNTGQDGHVSRAPVGCYAANDYGVYDMIGNVWEWTSSWYYPGHQQNHAKQQHEHGFDPRQAGIPVRVIKGGSFLCAPNYCKRYRPSARHAQDLSLGASHLGFRTIKRVKPD